MRRSMRGTTLNVFDEKGFEWSYYFGKKLPDTN